jgi:hypothetical protein
MALGRPRRRRLRVRTPARAHRSGRDSLPCPRGVGDQSMVMRRSTLVTTRTRRGDKRSVRTPPISMNSARGTAAGAAERSQ